MMSDQRDWLTLMAKGSAIVLGVFALFLALVFLQSVYAFLTLGPRNGATGVFMIDSMFGGFALFVMARFLWSPKTPVCSLTGAWRWQNGGKRKKPSRISPKRSGMLKNSRRHTCSAVWFLAGGENSGNPSKIWTDRSRYSVIKRKNIRLIITEGWPITI